MSQAYLHQYYQGQVYTPPPIEPHIFTSILPIKSAIQQEVSLEKEVQTTVHLDLLEDDDYTRIDEPEDQVDLAS